MYGQVTKKTYSQTQMIVKSQSINDYTAGLDKIHIKNLDKIFLNKIVWHLE